MSKERITVKLLNREYPFSCEPEERPSLLMAADYLDSTMREIKQNNSTLSHEKIALMSAMNIAHELIKAQSLNQQYDSEVMSTIKKLNGKLEQAIAND
ncbi:cell division protein ZapA [Marinicella gelatinilytica]|uniref:cell division protein ZapA n=1 Tax=Marinicella gelatinilytica TaxID=2996017 RepID=UPI002260A252|nr:cell division protein ZapA [Marinicella gelatinilytica]MCX7545975.1 cell division protein ZapA [Marinicella gelatinilytica]